MVLCCSWPKWGEPSWAGVNKVGTNFGCCDRMFSSVFLSGLFLPNLCHCFSFSVGTLGFNPLSTFSLLVSMIYLPRPLLWPHQSLFNKLGPCFSGLFWTCINSSCSVRMSLTSSAYLAPYHSLVRRIAAGTKQTHHVSQFLQQVWSTWTGAAKT